MSGAGDLRERLKFQSLSAGSDGYGNENANTWHDEFTVSARVQFLKGGESIMAARLSGTQPCIIQVRQSPETLLIQADWQAVDVVSGKIYQIKAPPANMDEKNDRLDILAEMGVAA